jgi:hypothetical protein
VPPLQFWRGCAFVGTGRGRIWGALALCCAYAGSQVARAAALYSIVVCGKRESLLRCSASRDLCASLCVLAVAGVLHVTQLPCM